MIGTKHPIQSINFAEIIKEVENSTPTTQASEDSPSFVRNKSFEEFVSNSKLSQTKTSKVNSCPILIDYEESEDQLVLKGIALRLDSIQKHSREHYRAVNKIQPVTPKHNFDNIL